MNELLFDHFLKHKSISTDSRNISNNDIFFALKGDRFDGNKYTLQALEKGAAYAVIDNKEYAIDDRCILVADSLKELQELAKKYREKLTIPVLAITGTNGKTTTKELIYSVLNQKYNTFATRGNLNNHIGVPLSLLSIPDETEIAIIEMGANHIGEIATLCEIAQPGFGLITNIGKAHLEGFGSYEGVIKGKTELYNFLKYNSGYAFVNADDRLLQEQSKDIKTIPYSCKNIDSRITIAEHFPSLILEWDMEGKKTSIKTQLFGDYNMANILSAIAVGQYFNVNNNSIIEGIEDYRPENLRSQILQKESNTIILDAYNANPSSMSLAIENFSHFHADNKMLILGDMLELGVESRKEHEFILGNIDSKTFSNVILIGEEFGKLSDSFDFRTFKSTDEAILYLKEHPVKNTTVLMKGSRGIALENLLDVL